MSATRRFAAIERACSRPGLPGGAPRRPAAERASTMFGELLFHEGQQRKLLPKKIMDRLRRCSDRQERLDRPTADAVASAMMEWALSLGASHFCHWFQPQTGSTAEKHDAFLDLDPKGKPLERFSGTQLIQGEPDASSFPSGGVRSTFEARGYTAWDPSSPAFILERAGTRTLCIPSIFLAYHGEALDEKTPLLRSMAGLDEASLALLRRLGERKVRWVRPTLGVEQEYFLIDRAFAAERPDLLLAGTTVLGAPPAKGQQLDDHYFGPIKERILAYMEELDRELTRLGIPAKTRHNEVAPCQFELACLYETAHLAADHNMITMEVMRTVARRHDFHLLLHEKPFAGINGSGKHCNWSLADDLGRNFLEPGDTPSTNLRFLCFLTAVLMGVHRHGDLLRASVASSGNDHRLGAQEAPPAIMSVFLGKQLSAILDEIAAGNQKASRPGREFEISLPHIPTLARDHTDRNRTSPIAFTGNKFEFRAVGSAQTVATPVALINTMVAEALRELEGELSDLPPRGKARTAAILDVLRRAIETTRPIRFEGDGYGAAWVLEAQRRGLPNLRKTPEALSVFAEAAKRRFLDEQGMLRPGECEARLHVKRERYAHDLQIQARLLLDMSRRSILPAALRFESELRLGSASPSPRPGRKRFQQKVFDRVEAFFLSLESLEKAMAKCSGPGKDLEDEVDRIATILVPAMAALRAQADALEGLMPDELWPFPTYQDMLFLY